MSASLNLANAESLNTIRITGNPSAPTRQRWAFTGVLSAAGQRVKLETWKAGGRRVTTPEAVDRFFFDLNSSEVAERGDSQKDAARRSATASAALESLGF